MDPNSKVELPPRGADLSFLGSGSGGDNDTPSRWLTFGGTPNGGTSTPGTAFGSPFWASLNPSKSSPKIGLGSTSGGIGGNASSYSPSKELNPFELSFFPKSETLAGGLPSESTKPTTGRTGAAKEEDDGAEYDRGKNGLSSSTLKRPFFDASNAPTPSDLSSKTTDSVNMNHNTHPAWKRPKFDPHSATTSESNASNLDLPGNGTSPGDDPSPASSMVPTPNVHSAVLPPSHGNGPPHGRKGSLPPEQQEANLLHHPHHGGGQHRYSLPGHLGGPPHEGPGYHNGAGPQGGFPHVQTLPNAMPGQIPSHGPSAYAYHGGPHGLPPPQHQHHHPYHHPHQQQQPGPQGTPHHHQHQHQHHQSQHGQVILPPVQHHHINTHPPQHSQPPTQSQSPESKPKPSPTTAKASHPQQQPSTPAGQAVPLSGAIPYANGRNPSQNSVTRSKSGIAGQGPGGKGRPIKGAVSSVHEDDDEGSVASSSNNTASTTPTTTTKTSAGKGASAFTTAATTKKGKKLSAAEEKKRKAAAEAAAEKEAAEEAAAAAAEAAAAAASAATKTESQDGQIDEDDEEEKRKAFLERNRQAACRSRQKKKEWIGNLENHAASLQAQNTALAAEIESLRKEMFALRHTLSFHERCGCPSIQDWMAKEGHRIPPGGLPPHHLPPHHMGGPGGPPPPHLQSHPLHYPQGPPGSHHGPLPPHMQPMQGGPSADPAHQAPLQQAQPRPYPPPPQDIHVSAASPVNAMSPVGPVAGPTPLQAPPVTSTASLAPTQHTNASARPGGMANQGPHVQVRPQQINLSSHSLRPQPHSQMPPSHSNSHSHLLGSAHEIVRPGSAGATFGLSTPNFADLFNGAMPSGQPPTSVLGGMNTPGIFGGLLQSGNFSPNLPNTFGLALSDIPTRPASAPPTPSPAINDPRLFAPASDYFTIKKTGGAASQPHGSAAFGDLLMGASLPSHLGGGSINPTVMA